MAVLTGFRFASKHCPMPTFQLQVLPPSEKTMPNINLQTVSAGTQSVIMLTTLSSRSESKLRFF